MSGAALLIQKDGGGQPVRLVHASDGAAALAAALGSAGLREAARAEAASIAMAATGDARLDEPLRGLVERFLGPLPAMERARFAERLGTGDLATAGMVRRVVSFDEALAEAEPHALHGSPLDVAAGSLLAAHGWTLAAQGQEAPAPSPWQSAPAPEFELRSGREGLELSGEASALAPFESAAAALNAQAWPMAPFQARSLGGRASFAFQPGAALRALCAARLCRAEWIEPWIASGGPSLGEMARGSGCSEAAMAARLWMDAQGALDAKPASAMVELSRWRPAFQGAASPRAPARGQASAAEVNLAFNESVRLLGCGSAPLRALGESTLLNLARRGGAGPLAGALEAVLEADGDKSALAANVKACLSKIQAIALDAQSGVAAGAVRSPGARL